MVIFQWINENYKLMSNILFIRMKLWEDSVIFMYNNMMKVIILPAL